MSSDIRKFLTRVKDAKKTQQAITQFTLPGVKMSESKKSNLVKPEMKRKLRGRPPKSSFAQPDPDAAQEKTMENLPTKKRRLTGRRYTVHMFTVFPFVTILLNF